MVIENTSHSQSNVLPQDRLHVLYQIIERMNSVYELPDLLAFILDRLLEHTGGLRGYLLLAQQSAADDRYVLQPYAIQQGVAGILPDRCYPGP